MSSPRLLAMLAVFFASTACLHFGPKLTPLSSAEVAQRGTQRYANVTRDQTTQACAAALQTLGYQVTVAEPQRGIVKTAPLTVATTVTGDYTASVTEDGLAWGITVEATGKDVVVHAMPRGFRNGTEMRDEGIWAAEMLDPKFKDLWHELSDTLNVAQPKS